VPALPAASNLGLAASIAFWPPGLFPQGASSRDLAREGPHVAKAHVCLGCFELAESTGFASIVESMPPQEFQEIETGHLR
jgi:hypothetical protein